MHLTRRFAFSTCGTSCSYQYVYAKDESRRHVKYYGKYLTDGKRRPTEVFWTQLEALLVEQVRSGTRPLTIINQHHDIVLPDDVFVGAAVSVERVIAFLCESPEGAGHAYLLVTVLSPCWHP